MAVYAYKAFSSGSDVSGVIAAETPRHARALLDQRGLVVRDVRDVSRRSRPRSTLSFHLIAPVRRHELTALFGELATLLQVGVPLLESLDTLARQHDRATHRAIVRLRDRVSGGGSLAAAMREQPRIFDDLAISITEVGEDAGTLDQTLQRLAEFREKSDQLRNRVGTALIYPTIVTALGVACGIFLMSFVVPQILQPLLEQNLPLPLPTRIVKSASDILLADWPLLIAIVLLLAGAGAALISTDRGRQGWHEVQLKLPLLGTLIRKQMIVRVAVVLSTLLKSGIVLTRSMEIARRSISNRVVAGALRDVETQITSGIDLSGAMETTGVFPPMVVQVFALGQQSGQLEEMLDRLAINYETQVATAAQRMTAILEPMIIVVLGGVCAVFGARDGVAYFGSGKCDSISHGNFAGIALVVLPPLSVPRRADRSCAFAGLILAGVITALFPWSRS